MEVEVFCFMTQCQDAQSIGHDLHPVPPENKAGWSHLKCDILLQVRDMFHRVL